MLLQKQTLRMWNPETDFPNANGTAITIQTSPTAEKETIVIVAVLVTCVLSLALTAVSIAGSQCIIHSPHIIQNYKCHTRHPLKTSESPPPIRVYHPIVVLRPVMIGVSPVNDKSPTENLQRAYYIHVEFAVGLWPSVLYHPSCFPSCPGSDPYGVLR